MKVHGVIKKLSVLILIISVSACMLIACDRGKNVDNPEYAAFYDLETAYELWLNEYNRLFVLSYQNGIYIGKINGMNENYDIKVAIKGNLLYIDGWYGIGQYKLDTSYEVSNDIVQKLEPPKDYIIKINDIRKPVVYFKWHLTSGYYGVGELKPAKENNYTIFRFGIQGIGKMSIYFTFDELMTGSNIMKIYIVGGPVINWDKKLLYSTQDSPCLLYEVYVYEDNTVTVT